MAKQRYTQKRDMRFDDWRRNNIKKGGKEITLKIYSTDIDSLEYKFVTEKGATVGTAVPVALIEKKDKQSTWKENWLSLNRTAMRAQFALCKMAGIPYYVMEHMFDFSHITVYQITSLNKMPDETDVVIDGALCDYVEFLYKIRGEPLPKFYYETIAKVKSITEEGESNE